MGISINLAMLIPFLLMFFLVAALVIYRLVTRLSEETANNNAPVQNVTAKVVSKRTETHRSGGMTDANGMMTSGSIATKYYVTFEAPDGSRLELPVKGEEYGLLAEGDYGQLTYQRKRYHGFVRQPAPVQTASDEEIIARALAAQMLSDPESIRQMAAQPMPAEPHTEEEPPQQQRMQF